MSDSVKTGSLRDQGLSAEQSGLPPAATAPALLILPSRFPYAWGVSAAVTLALYASRTPQTFNHPQFWAEDGAVFFSEAYRDGPAAFIHPYAGYLHLVPRLTAALAMAVSAVHAPAIYAGISVAVTLWSAATIAAAALPFAWVLGAMLMLLPHTGEIFGTITNVQWLMAPALAMIVATPAPEGRLARLNQLAFAVASGFSGPFAVFAAPVAAVRAWTHRDRFSLLLGAIVLIAAAVQAGLIATDPVSALGTTDAAYVGRGVLDRWIGQLALGQRTGTALDLVVDALLLAAALAALRYDRKAFLGLFAFATLFMATTWIRFLRAPLDTFDGLETGDRYFYVPRLVLLWGVVFTLLRGRRASTLIAAIVLVIVATHERQWRKPPLEIMPWRAAAQRIDRGEGAEVVINPPIPPEDGPWTVAVPPRSGR